jgi:uncharacterized membrane protein
MKTMKKEYVIIAFRQYMAYKKGEGKTYNGAIHIIHSSSSIVNMLKSRAMSWARDVAL